MGIEGPTRERESSEDSAAMVEGPREHGHGRARGQMPTAERSHTLAAVASNDEIEAAIVRAMLDGRGDVADVLTRTLRARREASAPNVVQLRRGAS
jgi:hypothetical protein